MPAYRYLALNRQGVPVRGRYLCANEAALHVWSQTQALELIEFAVLRQSVRHSTRLPLQTVIFFCHQMHALLQAGLPLLQALTLFNHTDYPVKFRELLQQLLAELESGCSLSEAISRHQHYFPPMLLPMLTAAEHTGHLPEVFAELATLLEWQLKLKQQVTQGLAYPALLALVVLGAAVTMLVLLVPPLKSFLNSMHHALPVLTRGFLALSDIVMESGLSILLASLLTGVLASIAFRYIEPLAYQRDHLLLRCPWIGQVTHYWLLALFCRFWGRMYQSGIPVIHGLQLCQPLLQNRAMESALTRVRQAIEGGEGLASSFKHSAYFPATMLRLLQVAEQTGTLDQSLFQLSRYYEQECQRTVQWLLRMMEPLITLSLGALLMLLMLAVLMPVYDSMSAMP